MSHPFQDRNRVLFVGLSCYDVISICSTFPNEDEDVRVLDQALRRGGNASNSSTCFSCLLKWSGKETNRVEFFGTIGGDIAAQFMMNDMANCGVINESVVCYPNSISPMAMIIINKENGSRTILHCNKDLPELTSNDFKSKISLSKYRWIHFEVRPNVEQVIEMVKFARISDKNRIKLSMEFEKPTHERDGIWRLDIDLFFVSKDYATYKGAKGMDNALDVLSKMIPLEKRTETLLVIPWGHEGSSCAVIESGKIIKRSRSQAFTPRNGIKDTTGAGDSFIAATVFALDILSLPLEESITFACRFAGAKCGVYGNQGLEHFENLL